MKKIVIIGPESTGKSTLCAQLAQHFHTKWCPEYARQYLVQNGTSYQYEDLLAIAQGQLKLEDAYLNRPGSADDLTAGSGSQKANPEFIFIDTDMYVMKVWCEFVYQKCHQYILDQIALRKYDLYLLCNLDLPWVKDELREYPDEQIRKELFCMYKDILLNQDTPWVEIKGSHEIRKNQAVASVSSLF